MTETSPLSDFRQLVVALPALDANAGETVRARLGGENEPNRLEAAAIRLAQAQRKPVPTVRQPVVALFAAAHGIASRGVGSRNAGAVVQAVERLGQGGEQLNALCAAGGLGLKVLDLAPSLPTADFTLEPALSARNCAATVAFGMEAVAGGADLLVLTGLAAGAATSAAAIGAAFGKGKGADWTGEGVPEHVRLRRAAVIDAALALHGAAFNDPLEVLRCLGGRETAAIAGAIAAARTERAAVVLDGEAAVAAALVLHALRPDAVGHCFLAQRPQPQPLARAAAAAGMEPLLDLGIEGAGEAGAVAAGLLKAAAGLTAASVNTVR